MFKQPTRDTRNRDKLNASCFLFFLFLVIVLPYNLVISLPMIIINIIYFVCLQNTYTIKSHKSIFLIWLSKMKRMMALESWILISGNDAEALAVLRDGTHVQACLDDLKWVKLGWGKPAVSLTDLIYNISTFLQSGASQKRKSHDKQSWCFPSILKWATLAMYCGIPPSYNQVSCHGAQPCWTFFFHLYCRQKKVHNCYVVNLSQVALVYILL